MFYDFLKGGAGFYCLRQNRPHGGSSSLFLVLFCCFWFVPVVGWADSTGDATGDSTAVQEEAGLGEPGPMETEAPLTQETAENVAMEPEKPPAKAGMEGLQKAHSASGESPKRVRKKPRAKKSRASKKESQWILFEWLNTNQISLQWAYGFLDQEQKDLYSPPLLKKNITESFKHESLIFLNFHHNIIRFPYILHWGLRGGLGLARNYDLKSDFFVPLSLSGILSLKLTKHQPVVPFVEGGFSSWNRNLSDDFSDIFPYWTVGAFISLSLFKPSLTYTFPNDYGFKDLGFAVEWRNHVSPFKKEKRGTFLRTLHVGLYMAL